MRRTGPVRIEHREQTRVRHLGWHAGAFDTVFDSLVAEGAAGLLALVSVETGEVLMTRPLPASKRDSVVPDSLSSESTSEA